MKDQSKTQNRSIKKQGANLNGWLIDDILNPSAVGILILDSAFHVVWVNKALECYFGLKKEEIIGKDKRKLIHERIKHTFEDSKTFARKVLATYDNNTDVENFECHVVADGERQERWLEHWSQPIQSGPYSGGRVEYYYDITKLERLQKELARAQRLETAGRVAGQIAHDFNNLLGPLVAYPTLIREELPQGHPILKMVAEIEFTANKIAEINRQLLASLKYKQSTVFTNSQISYERR